MPRTTEQEYRRNRIRYFFSWEGLSKFLLAPVFNIGLTSVIITPFIARVYIALGETFGSFFGHMFPIHMGLLFLSGLSVVIARIIYELSCPKLVKACIDPSSLDIQKLQNKQWLQVELEYCLLQYVRSLPMTVEYIRAKKIEKMRESTGEAASSMWTPVPEFPGLQIGFNVYGVWLIQNLLVRIAKEKKNKLFDSRDIQGRHIECEASSARWDINYTVLYHIHFDVVDKYKAEQEGINEGDFLLRASKSSHEFLYYSPKDELIENYFRGLHKITDLGANDTVKEFIAENENYWRPFVRIGITFLLLLSITFLLSFFIMQTAYVFKAIYLYFLK
jgi:hypothetical protein